MGVTEGLRFKFIARVPPPPLPHGEGGLRALLTFLRLLKTRQLPPPSPASIPSLEPGLLQGKRWLTRGLMSM